MSDIEIYRSHGAYLTFEYPFAIDFPMQLAANVGKIYRKQRAFDGLVTSIVKDDY
jgi:hypothetical protein